MDCALEPLLCAGPFGSKPVAAMNCPTGFQSSPDLHLPMGLYQVGTPLRCFFKGWSFESSPIGGNERDYFAADFDPDDAISAAKNTWSSKRFFMLFPSALSSASFALFPDIS